MSETDAEEQTKELVLEFELDAPPEKVWRAISTDGLRERWLPGAALADAEPISSAPSEEIRYRMRDDEPPFLESVVTFQLSPNADGGTSLRVIHELADASFGLNPPKAANNNGPCLVRAA